GDRHSNRARVASKSPLPVLPRDHRHRSSSWLIVIIGQHASTPCLYTQALVIAAAGILTGCNLRSAVHHQIELVNRGKSKNFSDRIVALCEPLKGESRKRSSCSGYIVAVRVAVIAGPRMPYSIRPKRQPH